MGFGVWGLGRLGFRVWGLGFRGRRNGGASFRPTLEDEPEITALRHKLVKAHHVQKPLGAECAFRV